MRVIPIITLLIISLLAALSSSSLTPASAAGASAADIAWMLTASCLVLLMTPGLSFFYGGMVSKKNIISTMLQSFVAMGVVSVLWVTLGFSLAFGDSIAGVIGDPRTFLFFRNVEGVIDPKFAATIPLALFALFQLKFAIITPALVTGAFAERVRFSSYMLFVILFSLLIYSPLAHATWHPDGFLRQLGVLDFAGGTVVHMSAGFAALAAALVLGPRRAHTEKRPHLPANIPYVMLGTGMLWFGWFGFNAGSALAANQTAVSAFLTTNTASAAAMLAWIFFDIARGRKPSALGACIGAVVGLVAITPAAGYVSVNASITIGIISSIISNVAANYRMQSTIDDTLDVFPCHGLGGLVGMILTGVFARDTGLIAGKTDLFALQVGAAIGVSVFCFVGALAILSLINYFLPFRVSVSDELTGLDLSQHGERYGTPPQAKIFESEQQVVGQMKSAA